MAPQGCGCWTCEAVRESHHLVLQHYPVLVGLSYKIYTLGNFGQFDVSFVSKCIVFVFGAYNEKLNLVFSCLIQNGPKMYWSVEIRFVRFVLNEQLHKSIGIALNLQMKHPPVFV